MKHLIRFIVLSLLVVVIGACARSNFFLRDVNKNLSHSIAVNRFADVKNQYAFWGGTILSGKNLKDKTELVILAYPLNNYGEPITDASSFGRFVVIQQGYLELGEYANDRNVSLVGQLTAIRKGNVGESQYIYPVLSAQQMRIWAEDPDVIYDDSHFRFHFGVGIHRHHHY